MTKKLKKEWGARGSGKFMLNLSEEELKLVLVGLYCARVELGSKKAEAMKNDIVESFGVEDPSG